jgi:hypothetical protein
MKRWVALCFLGSLVPQPVLGARLFLVWEFERTYTPPPSSFRVTYTDPTGQTLAEMDTAPSPVGACTPPAAPNPETYCTVWPSCPPAGVVMTFWVQARWSDGQLSARSELVLCLFTVEQPCVCQDPATYVAPVVATLEPPRIVFTLPASGSA